jgi:hydrogenase maturation protein HypF
MKETPAIRKQLDEDKDELRPVPQATRVRIIVTGIVQGVGFRPFVHRLATRFRLGGNVRNATGKVVIEAEGPEVSILAFLEALRAEAPPASRIEAVAVERLEPAGDSSFAIRQSEEEAPENVFVSPDLAICADCRRELLDKNDRRYRYPFINCTNCGPRFSIIEHMPYDRERTTMREFRMCAKCYEEYSDPISRRYHAQPNACPVCGPHLWLEDAGGNKIAASDPVRQVAAFLREGKVVAIKGLGGFHIACNASDEGVVNTLRDRKLREEKPLALMCKDLKQVRSLCRITPGEAGLLTNSAAPILLLPKRNPCPVADSVAPSNNSLGVMLPYTPLHLLLMEEVDFPLVMTSGNLTDDPIAIDNEDARRRLSRIVDYYLLHNRDIHASSEDSVVRGGNEVQFMVRRSRGFAPSSMRLPLEVSPTLGCGAELKSAICFAKGNYAFLGEHIGDLENELALERFKRSIARLSEQLMIEPEIIAYDLHPEYLSTKYAIEQSDARLVGIQHHRAHIAACMVENHLTEPVIGVALDGLGYGDDAEWWGFEFFQGDYSSLERGGTSRPVPMPGGAKAIKEPWRMALSFGHDALGDSFLEKEMPWKSRASSGWTDTVHQMLHKGINSPFVSSCGRLFDAVASLMNMRHSCSFEGQAAMELEALALKGREKGSYPFLIETNPGSPFQIDFRPLVKALLEDISRGREACALARKFHNTIAEAVAAGCVHIAQTSGLDKVALSGGCLQNVLLWRLFSKRLTQKGFQVFTQKEVPPNDGGIALGQVLLANAVSASPSSVTTGKDSLRQAAP